MPRRFVIAGLAALLAPPAFVVEPASAAALFTCSSVTGSATLAPGLVHDKRAQSLSSGPTAPAGPADITRASRSDTGVGASPYSSLGASLSADGSSVAFWSQAINLDPADRDSRPDAYVKDLDTGDIILASTSDTGIKGNSTSFSGSLSPDGTKVTVSSFASNLGPADTDTITDAYVKDLETGDITLVSTSDAGIKGNGASFAGPISADGTRVVFNSAASNLHPRDTDTLNDVYVKNLGNGNTRLVSTSDAGVKGNGRSYAYDASADGTKVGFFSQSTNLDPGDTDAVDDVYIKDLSTGNLTLASTSDSGVKGNGESDWLALSADGTTVVFHSRSTNLDPADTDSFIDVYVKDLVSGDITLVSTSDTGIKGDADSEAPDVSADATKVAFHSDATNLDFGHTPRPSYADKDVYVKELGTGNLTLASTSDTMVNGNDNSWYASLSADGTVVGFHSGASNLVPPDRNGSQDIFVKRLPSIPTSVDIRWCNNGQSGAASIVDIRSLPPRPLGCPQSLGGAPGNDYDDRTLLQRGDNPSFEIDWASGPNSHGIATVKAGPTGTRWRIKLTIIASEGHDKPETNQYLPAAGSGFTKTTLKGTVDVRALDGFDCVSGADDPISWVSLIHNGNWVATAG